MRIAFEGEAARSNEQQTEQQLPCGVRQWLNPDFRPFDVDGGECPAERTAERVKHERRKSIGKQRPQKDRDADDAKYESKPAYCVQSDRKSTRLNSSHMSISYAVF